MCTLCAVVELYGCDIVDFQISKEEAVRRFNDYQRRECKYLHAHSILGDTSTTVTPMYLPYWYFSATISSEAKAKLGYKDDKLRAGLPCGVCGVATTTGSFGPHAEQPGACIYLYAVLGRGSE